MTVASHVPALRFDTPAEAIAAMRGRGLRLSTARRLVLEALFAAEGPVTAPHLAATVAIDESSVYRNLEVLESHGFIRHVHLGHGPGLYVLPGGDEVEYLYCDRCAKVTAVAADRLDPVHDSIRERFGYETQFTHFAIVGLCADCAARPLPGSATVDDVDSRPTGSHRHRHSAELEASQGDHGTHDHADSQGDHGTHDHAHSHGDYVHSHPHPHSHPGHGNGNGNRNG